MSKFRNMLYLRANRRARIRPASESLLILIATHCVADETGLSLGRIAMAPTNRCRAAVSSKLGAKRGSVVSRRGVTEA